MSGGGGAAGDEPVDQPALFEVTADMVVAAPGPVPGAALTADRRRTLRQREAIERGWHPLSAIEPRLRLHPEAAPPELGQPGRRCGNCRWRTLLNLGTSRDFPKCSHPGTMTADQYTRTGGPRVTGSAASDVRRWWPACTDHEYGDPDLSPDAHRQTPPDQPEGWPPA